jgi:hypothetical protein
MPNVTQAVGTRTTLGSLGTLASATYLNVGTLTFNTNKPLDVELEVSATPGTVSGNKQLKVFAQQSLDGTNFETGPVSGTTTTDEPNLTFIGTVPLNSNATLQRKVFKLAAAFGGTLPHSAKIIVLNDSGAALSSGSVEYSEVTTTVA